MILRFEPTRDMDLVRQVVTHPRLYRVISDDKAPAPADYQPDPALDYVKVLRGEDLLGLFALLKMPEAWEVHTCLLPLAWGAAVEIGRAFLAWLWENTDCPRLASVAPLGNRLAIRLARLCGMEQTGIASAAWRKANVVQDALIFEIGRPA